MNTLRIGNRIKEFLLLKQAIAHADQLAAASGLAGMNNTRAARSLCAATQQLEDVPEWQPASVLLLREAVVQSLTALTFRRQVDIDRSSLTEIWNHFVERAELKPTLHALSPALRDQVAQVITSGLGPEKFESSSAELRPLREALAQIADSLVPRLEAEIYAPKRLRVRARIRTSVAGALVLLTLVYGARAMSGQTHGTTNLATRARVTTVSTYRPDVYDPKHLVDGDTVAVGCHTEIDNRPWALFDLKRPYTIHRVVVTNRSDGELSSLAVPLVVETSTDGETFTTFARQDSDFKLWTATGTPTKARYVRIAIDKKSVLHLNEVEIY